MARRRQYSTIILLCLISAGVSLIVCSLLLDGILLRLSSSLAAFIFLRLLLAAIIFTLMMFMVNRRVTRIHLDILSVLYIFFILLLSFFRGQQSSSNLLINLNPFVTIRNLGTTYNSVFLFIGNILLYIPIGFIIKNKMANARIILVFLVFTGFVLLVESCQLLFRVGIFDISDILLNVFGMSIGAVIWRLVRKITG